MMWCVFVWTDHQEDPGRDEHDDRSSAGVKLKLCRTRPENTEACTNYTPQAHLKTTGWRYSFIELHHLNGAKM